MSYTQSFYHIVFRTKNSERTITENVERLLYKYIYNFSTNKGCLVLRIGGMPDHVHLLAGLPPTLAIAVYVKTLKETTSRWMRTSPDFPYFTGWAKGYAALSCGYDSKDSIISYIMRQKEHHRSVSFADEYRSLLLSAGIKPDEAYFLKDDT